ncbi:MAG: hypothetical protein PHP64_04515 [Actinomycetota bacterium]|nr:hypothetical protein [Actinomycetota bacterium]
MGFFEKGKNSELRKIDGEVECYYCGEARASVVCHGCSIPICSSCVRLEDYGFGCDGGNLIPFCPKCYNDPQVNTVLKFE